MRNGEAGVSRVARTRSGSAMSIVTTGRLTNRLGPYGVGLCKVAIAARSAGQLKHEVRELRWAKHQPRFTCRLAQTAKWSALWMRQTAIPIDRTWFDTGWIRIFSAWGEKSAALLFEAAMHALRSIQYGGNNREWAKTLADEIEAALDVNKAKESGVRWN